MEKRTWWYIQSPATFEVAGCKCGNTNTQWSEYKKHVWCSTCQIDFIPEHYGIIDGPIPACAAHLLGIVFDRWNDELKCVERFNLYTCEYELLNEV